MRTKVEGKQVNKSYSTQRKMRERRKGWNETKEEREGIKGRREKTKGEGNEVSTSYSTKRKEMKREYNKRRKEKGKKWEGEERH